MILSMSADCEKLFELVLNVLILQNPFSEVVIGSKNMGPSSDIFLGKLHIKSGSRQNSRRFAASANMRKHFFSHLKSTNSSRLSVSKQMKWARSDVTS